MLKDGLLSKHRHGFEPISPESRLRLLNGFFRISLSSATKRNRFLLYRMKGVLPVDDERIVDLYLQRDEYAGIRCPL